MLPYWFGWSNTYVHVYMYTHAPIHEHTHIPERFSIQYTFYSQWFITAIKFATRNYSHSFLCGLGILLRHFFLNRDNLPTRLPSCILDSFKKEVYSRKKELFPVSNSFFLKQTHKGKEGWNNFDKVASPASISLPLKCTKYR